MYITFQGTAAAEGAPALFCNCQHCRYAREVGGKEIRMRAGSLIDGRLKLDFGPDAYAQSLRFHQNYSELRYVLFTHAHTDHLAADELQLVGPPYAHGNTVLQVYGDARVGEKLAPHLNKDHLAFTQVFPFETYDIGRYRVTPLQAVHAIHSGEEPLTYIIEKDGRSLLYLHDTDFPTDEDMAFLRGRRVDMVSMDCTNGILNLDYIGHMGIEDNLRLREMLIENGTADADTVFVANHFSHNGLVAHEELEKRLPGFIVAFDGLTLTV